MSFRYKFILSFILIEAFFILLIVVYNTSLLKNTSEELVAQKIDAATELFIQIVKIPLLVNDLATLDDAVGHFVSISSVVKVQVLSSSGEVLSEKTSQSALLKTEKVKLQLPKFMDDVDWVSGSSLKVDDRHFITFSQFISIGAVGSAEVRFIYDMNTSRETVNRSAFVTYTLAALALLISTFIAVILGFRITKQLNMLTATANEIANDNPVLIPTYRNSGDEINLLFDAMKAMQQKIIDRTEEMTAARSRAQVASKAKSEFLAVMSHEIRTPLNGMIGSLNLMDKDKLCTEDAKYLDTVRKSSSLLTTVINDILDYAKIEAGRFSLENHVVDLESLVKEVEQFYRPLAMVKGLLLDVKFINLERGYVRGDGIRIKQILSNYLNNAFKFTSHGNIYLTLEQLPDDAIKLSVRDTGIGINAEDMSKLFTEFSQVDNGSNRSFGGSGLGLAISKRLAVLMGGEIGVESLFGEGTVFWVILRLELSTRGEYEQQNQSQQLYDNEILEGMSANILLVEDNRVNQIVARKLLEKQGCKVTIANHGVEALDKLYKGEFDLILMDCQMPIMDGFEATRKIRQLGNDIPIIALTANAQNSDREACLESGMNDFLSKPFDPRHLYGLIRRHRV